MTQKSNGYRYRDYYLWESTKQTPYNYEREGLVKRIVSKPIAETENPILKIVLQIYETSINFILRSTDILKNFKNIHWKNR